MELVKCKACGFIMKAHLVGDLCPACGLKAKVFEPFTPKMSESRFGLLDKHIHPISIHLPQAFAMVILVLSIALMALPADSESLRLIGSVLTLLTPIFPLLVLFGMITGMIDGRARFRKITTPILKMKITVSLAFLLFSTGIPLCSLVFPGASTLHKSVILALSILCMICSAILGKSGSSLVETCLPG